MHKRPWRTVERVLAFEGARHKEGNEGDERGRYKSCWWKGNTRGRGRMRSLSPVQTFTNYETIEELPVLGTGCR
jgi:predicted transcriptional regulator